MVQLPMSRSWSARTFLIATLLVTMIALTFLTAFATKTAKAAANATVCGPTDSINNQGPYWLNNNLWGASSGSGSQCTSSNSISGSNLSWSTNWNWSGGPNDVKSYASAVLGWHWGYQQSGTGLPVQISSNTNVNTSWSFSVTGGSNQDVSYDLWVDPNPNLGATQASTEVMIWLYKNGSVQPAGSPVGDVTIEGTTWTLWSGYIGWNVYSFVRDSNTTSASLNIEDFLKNLGATRGLSASNYLLGVEAGTEIFTGTGQLNVNSYSTVVGGSGSSIPTPTPAPPTPTPAPPTPTPTSTPPTPTPTSSPGGTCSVAYSVQSQWPGGFTGNVTINNTGSRTINGWTLQFAFPAGQQIQNAWNTVATQQGAQVTAKDVGYNGTIAAGASTSFGFNASWNGNNPAPSSFTLNGVACH